MRERRVRLRLHRLGSSTSASASVRADGSSDMLRADVPTRARFREIAAEDREATGLDLIPADRQPLYWLETRRTRSRSRCSQSTSPRQVAAAREDHEADISDAVLHPVTRRPIAAMAKTAKSRWQPSIDGGSARISTAWRVWRGGASLAGSASSDDRKRSRLHRPRRRFRRVCALRPQAGTVAARCSGSAALDGAPPSPDGAGDRYRRATGSAHLAT